MKISNLFTAFSATGFIVVLILIGIVGLVTSNGLAALGTGIGCFVAK